MPPKRGRSESVSSCTLAGDDNHIMEAPANDDNVFNGLMPNNPQAMAFLHSPRFTNAMKKAATTTNATLTFNVTPNQAVEELRRFLALKVFIHDERANKLDPTKLMETMWQAAILDTQLHQELQAVLPFFIHHRPEGASDAEGEAGKVRLITMESVYHRFFGGNPLGMPREEPVPLADNRPRKKHHPATARPRLQLRLRSPIQLVPDGEDDTPTITATRPAPRAVAHPYQVKNEEYPRLRAFEDFQLREPYEEVSGHDSDDDHYASFGGQVIKDEKKNEAIWKDDGEVIVLSDDEDELERMFMDVKPARFLTLHFDISAVCNERPPIQVRVRDCALFLGISRKLKERFFKDKVGVIVLWFNDEVGGYSTPRSLGMKDGNKLMVQLVDTREVGL